MPYVKKENRPNLDEVVEAMVDACVCANGDLNYILYKFCKYEITPSYNNFKNYIGELEECATEIRRRILADYEDEKRDENGEV